MDYILEHGEPIVRALGSVGLLTAYLFGSFLVGLKAKNSFYRSSFAWIILSLLFTPLVAIVFLCVAGPHVDAWERVEATRAMGIEMEKQRKAHRDKMELHKMKATCKGCSAVVNITTREGVYSPEDEPWRVICKNCDRPMYG